MVKFNREMISSYAQILVGCVIGAAAYPLFLSPHYIAPGGLTGLATVLNYLFGWRIGIASLIMNVPLFIIGWHSMGTIFVFRSFFATVLFSVLIDVLPFQAVTMNPLLSSVFGGVFLGIGLGLILRGGATTGGTDMAARMLHKKMQHFTVGGILFVIDCISVAAAGIAIQVEYALYAFVAIYISDRVLDAVMLGLSSQKACYVITDAYEAVKEQIFKRLERGVTMMSAKGGFTNRERPVVVCVLSAQEVGSLKELVRECDPNAFMYITNVHEVLGEGFHSLKE